MASADSDYIGTKVEVRIVAERLEAHIAATKLAYPEKPYPEVVVVEYSPQPATGGQILFRGNKSYFGKLLFGKDRYRIALNFPWNGECRPQGEHHWNGPMGVNSFISVDEVGKIMEGVLPNIYRWDYRGGYTPFSD